MSSLRSSAARRTVAFVALSVLVVVLTGSTVAFAADPDAAGEPCVGCSGCDQGECGGQDGDPFTSHHHCCTTCCMSHAPLALPAVVSSPAPAIVVSTPTSAAAALTSRIPETLYRPPRA